MGATASAGLLIRPAHRGAWRGRSGALTLGAAYRAAPQNIYFSNEFMSGKKYTEEDICPVDLQVKTTVVTDAINLAKKKFTTIQETESFRSLTRVHPTQGEPDPADESEYVYQICEIMRKVYYSLTPLKNKAFMTA